RKRRQRPLRGRSTLTEAPRRLSTFCHRTGYPGQDLSLGTAPVLVGGRPFSARRSFSLPVSGCIQTSEPGAPGVARSLLNPIRQSFSPGHEQRRYPMNRFLRPTLWALAAALSSAPLAHAQGTEATPPTPPSTRFQGEANVNEVLLDVLVTDAKGNVIV